MNRPDTSPQMLAAFIKIRSFALPQCHHVSTGEFACRVCRDAFCENLRESAAVSPAEMRSARSGRLADGDARDRLWQAMDIVTRK